MYLRHIAAAALMLAGSAAQAATFTVEAQGNSSSGGTGLDTGISLTTGQSFSVMAGFTDFWSAGNLPRWSNADGLRANLFATAGDESGQPAFTLIGQDFGLWTQNGLSAPYGTLVASLGSTFFVLGTSFNNVAPDSGTLKLYYWDENNGDNSGSVLVNVASIPEPGTYALFFAGLGVVGFVATRRMRS